jgi:hypothetical protein
MKDQFDRKRTRDCTLNNEVFTTRWLDGEQATLWLIKGGQEVFIMISRLVQDYLVKHTIGLLKNKTAIEWLLQTFEDAITKPMPMDERNDLHFARKMLEATKRAFAYVDGYVDEDGQWHTGGFEF